ncbi:alpha/beta hydrolase [Bacillus spongiae]|uniref:Alpha/beta hydrolase n=1 Tax=Bacillus spongiae TaxID=2683610 RepID=A0ABU8HBY3_9BACI
MNLEIKHRKVHKRFRRLKFLGITLMTIILLTLVVGFVYEYTSYKNVKSNFPPDGKMIDVGNREIHVNIKGEKTKLPPVVIEAGFGSWSYDWSNIQKELSKHTEVITYDRAGYGWSDPPPNGFNIDMTINDLSKVLEYSNIDSPVILVGHSLGGIYTRLFADKYPEKVSGLILVDARNEYLTEKATSYNDIYYEGQDLTFIRIFSQFGFARLFGENMIADLIPDYLSLEKYVNVQYDTPFLKLLDQEDKQIRTLEKLVKLVKDTQHLDDKPLTIITPDENKELQLNATELGYSEQEASNIDQIWKDSQMQLTNISNNSELILVPNSGHNVMFDQPNVIIEAILNMADGI